MDQLPVAVFEMDAEGRLIFVNQSAQKSLGYSPEDLLKLGLAEWVAPEDRNRAAGDIGRRLKGELTSGDEYVCLRKDGSRFPAIVRLESFGGAGKPAGLRGVIVGIEERKKEEEKLRLTQAFVDHFSESCIWIAVDGRIIYVNDAACRSLGYSREELLQLAVKDIDPNFAGVDMVEYNKSMDHVGENLFETLHRTRDGRIFPVEVSRTYHSYGGNEYLLTFDRDITGRKLVENRLRMLSAAIEQSPTSVMVADTSGMIVYVNPQFSVITGVRSEDALGKPMKDLTFANTRPGQLSEIHGAIAAGQGWRGEIEYLGRGGKPCWVSAHIFPIKDERGTITHFIDVEEDITEQKLAEEELRRLFRALDQSPNSITIASCDGLVTYVNASFTRLTGVAAAEVIGKRKIDFTPKSTHQRIGSIIDQVMAGKEWRGERRTVKADGQECWVQVQISPIIDKTGTVTHFLVIESDITERKRNEEKLLLTQASIDNFRDPCTWSDEDGRILYVNDAACRTLGYSREELLRMKIPDIDPTIDDLGYREIFEATRALDAQHFETLHRTRDGRVFPVEISTKHISHGSRDLAITIDRDITGRKQTEDQLRKLSAAVEQSPAAVKIVGVDQKITYVNPKFTAMSGYEPGEAIGRLHREVPLGIVNPAVVPKLVEAIRAGKDWHGVLEYVRKSGEHFWAESHISAIRDEAGKIVSYVEITEDITERKLAEERLRSSLREKEVLLKEVHHRVKNNMQIISSLLNLQLSGSDQEPVRQILTESQNRIRSIALVHERMYMTEDLARIDFKEYVKSLSKQLLLSYSAHSGLVNLQVEGGRIYLGVDQAVPCGLIMNELISNSLKHAFPGSRQGTIRILLRSGEKNTIVIEDDGIGLPESFSLRETQSMGMQLVVALVDQLEGKIALERDRGTRFTIEFPIR